jgi:hypothetical protein
MKYLKSFNEEVEKSIEDWCVEFNISNPIIKDGVVDVNDGVEIKKIKSKIPIQFGLVTGDFICAYNELITLKGSPRKVKGWFHCSSNSLTSLDGGPEIVGHYYSDNNQLISLKGGPVQSKSFNCQYNNLTSLKEFKIDNINSLSCGNNKLTTLKGSPKKIINGFYCNNNLLKTLEWGPIEVGNDYYCPSNKLISLEGSPDEVSGLFSCINNPIYGVYILFSTLKRYKESIVDYNYLRGKTIVKRRFEMACEHAGIDVPDYIYGYKYI